MKTVCIYHSIDLDGWMSAAIVKHWFNTREYRKSKTFDELFKNVVEDTIDFIGYNYGQPIPDLSEYDKIIMCDISFDNTTMFNIVEVLNKELVWIDHHISAIKDNIDVELVEGIRNTKFAACELTWKYFFQNETMPDIVRLLGRYDCFGHKGTEEETKVLEFQYGARSVISNYETAYINLLKPIENTNNIHGLGVAVYNYLCTEARQTYKNGFEILLVEPKDNATIGEQVKKFICINKERFNPINFGIDYHQDGYDGCACFYYANNKWNFSLYNDNGLVDCSVIAKQFGGGGHKGAAGFVTTDVYKILNQ